MIKKEYSEKDYWEGRIPDELFDEYLEKYGYEYTPSVQKYCDTIKTILNLQIYDITMLQYPHIPIKNQ